MKKIYRISDKSNPFTFNFYYMTQEISLLNFVDVFGIDDLIVIADNCNKDTINFIKSLHIKDIRETSLGNAGTLKYAFEICYKEFDDNDVVFFTEDDFLYLPEPEKYLMEGLDRADYVSLYDHEDKYITGGQNPFIKNDGEVARIIHTKSIHWKFPNSISFICAVKVETLKEDWKVLHEYNFKGSITDSFRTTMALIMKGRKIITSIPGRFTPADRFPSPLTNWHRVAMKYRKDL